ncbi:MAG TPA: response regulator [Stellaceae bacterium]|nr:response regulator [Stellaceae bacterium]
MSISEADAVRAARYLIDKYGEIAHHRAKSRIRMLSQPSTASLAADWRMIEAAIVKVTAGARIDEPMAPRSLAALSQSMESAMRNRQYQPHHQSPVHQSPVGRSPSQRSHIVVVDDDVGIREVSAEVLEDAGYVVSRAASAQEALALLEAHVETALLFTDVVMPGIDGFMLADMAKARWPALRVAYATGYSDIMAARSRPGLMHGPVLNKPYTARQLSGAVTSLLEAEVPADGYW